DRSGRLLRVVKPPDQYDLWLDPKCQDADKLHQLVGASGQDCAGVDGLLAIFPVLPQAGGAKGPVIFEPNVKRLLLAVVCPLGSHQKREPWGERGHPSARKVSTSAKGFKAVEPPDPAGPRFRHGGGVILPP